MAVLRTQVFSEVHQQGQSVRWGVVLSLCRCGHVAVEDKETSPIFTQFLECVWQVMVQVPTAFQFNEHFLVTLHDHAHSCQFGTFLGNCEKERLEQG